MSDDPRALLREARALIDARKSKTEHPHRTGKEMASRGDFEGAASAFRRAIATNPDAPWSHVALGDALLEMQLRGEALTAYREALTYTPSSALALRESIGTGLLRSGDDTGAIAVLREVLAQGSDRSTTKVALARALLAQATAQQKEAALLLSSSEDADLDDELVSAALAVAPRTSSLLRRLAISLSARGDHDGAFALAQLGLAHDPGDLDLTLTLADIALARFDDSASAAQVFALVDEAFADRPTDLTLATRRAALADRIGDQSFAVKAWQDLAELQSDDALVHLEYGNRLALAGRFEDAGVAFDRSIELGYEAF